MYSLSLKSPKKIEETIKEFIRKEVKDFGRDGIILGLSGGIDSALDVFLSVAAVGSDRVLALFLPERDSSPQSRKDARLVAQKLGIVLKEISLTPILKEIGIYRTVPSTFLIPRRIQEKYVRRKYKEMQTEGETTFLRSLKGGEGDKELEKGIAYHRIKHRLRMILWYYYGELKNYLVVGNCNKTEKLTGYFVKYGDSGSDIDPIASLWKTQVRELAQFVGVPSSIIKKAPSPDLIPGITDEYALQISYEKLDQILYGLENKRPEEEIEKEADVTGDTIKYVQELYQISRHMRSLSPTPDLTNLFKK